MIAVVMTSSFRDRLLGDLGWLGAANARCLAAGSTLTGSGLARRIDHT
jgi:hypothetical protein